MARHVDTLDATTSSISWEIFVKSDFNVPRIDLAFSAAPSSAGYLYVKKDAAAGQAYDQVIRPIDPVGYESISIEMMHGFVNGDKVVIEYANPDGVSVSGSANIEIPQPGQFDGDLWYTSPYWDDIKFPFAGRQLDISAGRIDYDYVECAINFNATARYPEEVISMVCQMPHSYKTGTTINPHIHWIQNQNNTPNWLLAYRVYENGDTVPSFTLAAFDSNAFTWSAGSIMQITSFGEISMGSVTSVSAIVDFKVYRDSANTSGLFAGADPYTGDVLGKEFDVHFEMNSPGSRQEYIK